MNAATAPHPFDLLLDIDRRSRKQAKPAASKVVRASDMTGQLALQLGSWKLVFAMSDVAEIVPVPTITRVPGVKSWLLGIANLRGKVLSVIDLHRFLDGTATLITANSQIVVVRSGEWDYGLLVDEIIGMRHFGSDSRLPSLDGISTSIQPFVTEAFVSDKAEWLAFSARRLLEDPRFLDAAN